MVASFGARFVKGFKNMPSATGKMITGSAKKTVLWGKMLLTDYWEAIKQAGVYAKTHPIRFTVYTGTLGTAIAGSANNITTFEYETKIIESSHLLMLVPTDCRKPAADKYIRRLDTARQNGDLRIRDFGVGTIVYIEDFPEAVHKFEAQHWIAFTYLSTFGNKFMDISFFGKTPMLTHVMLDYDAGDPDE